MNAAITIPGAGNTITIAPSQNSVVITVAGKVIADSARALVLREGSLPPVFYIPRKDVDMARLERSGVVIRHPHMGERAFYNIPVGGARSLNAAWTCEAPHPRLAAIAGHIAFHPDRVDSIVEWFADYPSPLPGHDLALGPVQHTR